MRYLGGVLFVIPLSVALFGPWLTQAPPRRAPYSDAGLFGTDGLGRDVLTQTLLGGRSMLLLALVSLAAAYAVGILIGSLSAATRFDELLTRPLDIVLAVPAILLLLLVASTTARGPATVAAVVAVVNAPAIARVVRALALQIVKSPAAEAMRMQGEPWYAIRIGLLSRVAARPLLADAGSRITSAVYLVGAANFLGVGLAPTASDWAVAIDRNRPGILVQPWAVVLPALLVVAFAVGANLLADELTRVRDRSTEPKATRR